MKTKFFKLKNTQKTSEQVLQYDSEDEDYINNINVFLKQFISAYELKRKLRKDNFPWFLWNNDIFGNSFVLLSSFAVMKNAYFYEIEMQSLSSLRVGWTTRMSDFPHCGLSGNEQTLVLDYHQCFNPGDFIGCYVNVEENTAIFYINGNEIQQTVNENFFACTPIFAVANLIFENAIIVNFGQKPFKYLPHKKTFEIFYKSASNCNQNVIFKQKCCPEWFCLYSGIKRKYFLYEFSQSSFVMPTCFRDSKQYKFNQIVLQIEKMFMSTEEYGAIIAYAINELKKEKNMFVMSRFFQSLVEIAGQQITNQLTINFFNFVVSFILDFNNLFDPDQIGSKLHPILIHYFNFFQLNILSEKLLNFCFLLLNLIVISQENYCCGGYYDDVCTFLKTKCKIFLCNIFLQSFDPWLQLYAFVALKKVNDNKNIYLLLKSIDYALLKKKTEYFLNMNINEENIFEKIKKQEKTQFCCNYIFVLI